MKIFLSFVSILLIYSCAYQDKKNIKDDLLYKDTKNSIYLKRKIDIMSEKKSLKNQIRFFRYVFYNDSVYMLKDIVDINTFHFVISVTDTVKSSKYDIFEDKRHRYNFQYLPPTSPEIKAFDK